MPPPVEPKYHAQALRLLRAEPVASPAAVRAIEACEAKAGRRFPAAVREWYSVEGAETLLTEKHGGQLPLAEVLAGLARAAGSPPDLPVYHWQGSFDVVVALDGSDDPPARSLTHPKLGWPRPYSRFLSDEAWGKMTNRPNWFRIEVGAVVVAESKARVAPPHIDYLLEHFEQLPVRRNRRHEPLRWLRFFGPAGRVELVTAGDPTTGERPATWTLTADTAEAAVELYAALWPCHGEPVSLIAFRDPKVRRWVRDRIRRRVPGARFD